MVKIETDSQNRRVLARLAGELDHHSARWMREEIDLAVQEQLPAELILDFSGVSFMDSSGIGLVMGRVKLMQVHGGTVAVCSPSSHIQKVMRLSGIDRIAKFIPAPPPMPAPVLAVGEPQAEKEEV